MPITLLALFAIQAPVTIVLEGHRPTAEATVGTAAMKYLPFEVPTGITSMEIVTTIGDREGDRDTVDLGLFDPRGTKNGFRGWQGGTRRAATVTGSFATTAPWAIAGPLPVGRWSLAQYYLKASTKGLDYRYAITFRFDGPTPPRATPPVPKLPDPGGLPGWYVGNLHAHTLHSDGALTLPALAKKVRDAGFDFLVSSEHNTTAAHWILADVMREVPGLTLIPGTELTTPGGHSNFVGIKPGYWYDFRTQPIDGGLPKLLAEARRQRAVTVVNHPFDDCTSCAWTFRPEEWREASGIEVWNSIWNDKDEQALALWDSLLRQGRRIHAYGGSDFHRDPAPMGPATRVYAASRRGSDLVTGLRDGRTVITQSAKGPFLDLTVIAKGRKYGPGEVGHGVEGCNAYIEVRGAEGDVVTLHTARGSEGGPFIVGGDRFERSVPLPGLGLGFVRLELRHGAGRTMTAMTNAVFLPGKR